MTIDEAIAHEKIDSEPCSILCTHTTNRNDCIECRAYHKQLAEWLEELKEMRKNQGQIADFWYQEGISRAVKLIFNEIEEIKNRYDNEDFAIIGILIKIQEIALKTAEQLKAGEVNE